MYIVILGILPIIVSSQVLVTDLNDAVNSEGKLIKYIEEESVPYTGKVYHYYNNGTKELQGNYVRGFKHGKWTWWHTNGKRHKVGFYTKIKNRCVITGYTRSVSSKLKLSRIILSRKILNGSITGYYRSV